MLLSSATSIAGTGLNPLPTFTTVEASSTASYDPADTCFDYDYTVANPASNTGAIQSLYMDLSAPADYANDCARPLTIPRIFPGRPLNPKIVLSLSGKHIVDFGETVPDGWMGSVTSAAEGGFAAKSRSAEIPPGQSRGGFQIQSSNPPTLKIMRVKPHWTFETLGEASAQDTVEAGQAEARLVLSVEVIGPSSLLPGSEGHWTQFETDVGDLMQRGWITDQKFGHSILDLLAAAHARQGSAQAASSLQSLLSAVKASTASQRNEPAYDLLLLNTMALIDPTLVAANAK